MKIKNIFKNPVKIEGVDNDVPKDDDMKDAYISKKNTQLTPAKYEQLKSILTLIAFLIMFVIGYLILYTVNPTIFKYLLAANLLFGAHYLLVKMN